MKFFIFTILSIISANCCFSQTVEIEYDVVSKTVNVINSKKNSDTLHTKEIRLKPGSTVKFTLLNYNNEAFNVKTVSKKAVSIDTVLLTGNQNTIISFFQSKMVAPSLGSEFTSILGSLTKSKGSKVSPSGSSSVSINYDEFASIPEYNSEELGTVISSRLKAISNITEASIQLRKLRYETNLTGNKIKEESNASIEFLEPDTKRLFRNGKNRAEILSHLEKLAVENAYMVEAAAKELDTSIKKDTAVKSRGKNSSITNHMLLKNYNALKRASERVKEDSILASLSKLYEDYKVIQTKEYRHEFLTTIDANNDLLDIKFYLSKEADPKADPKVLEKNAVKSETFRFRINDIRVINTTGIVFASYFRNQQNYTLTNGKIQATDLDVVTPVISTMLNIISSGDAMVKLGGNFGVGIAVSESKGVHFMAGPTIALGRNNMFDLHFGITTSRLSRLGGGYKIGDSISGSEIPKVNRYELGSYFGISFNLSGIVPKK